MGAADRRRVEVAVVSGALAITVVFFLWLALGIGGKSVVNYFDDIVTAVAALSGCLACGAAAKRQSGAKRRFWALLTVALGAWTSAEVIWAVYGLVLHTSPVVSWADVGYLGAIPIAAVALLSHPGMHVPGRNKARATLDALAVGAALVFLSWTFVLGPLWHHTDLTTAGGIVAVAYPFGDLVIIFLIVQSVRSIAVSGRRPLLWVLVGLFAMAVSDSTYAYLVEAGRYMNGNLVDTGWVLGYLAIAVGATCDAGLPVYAAEETAETALVSFVTPYVPVILALSVITIKLELHQHVDRVSWLTGCGLAVLAIARQLLLLADRHEELFPSGRGPRGHGSGGQGEARARGGGEYARGRVVAPVPQARRLEPCRLRPEV